MQVSLPTEKEINVYDSLDEREACRHFLGKTLAEAEALFRDNSLSYQENLMWMGPIAFRFYVQAAIQYIQSSCSNEQEDFIKCFVGSLEFRMANERSELVPIAEQLANACRYIVAHYNRFVVAPEISDDLRLRCERLIQAFNAMIGAHVTDNH